MTNANQTHPLITRTQSKGKIFALAGISVMALASLTACQKARPKTRVQPALQPLTAMVYLC
ncbi:MAG: hypothetical protein U1E98_02495 [Moraxella osloensis]